MSVSSESCGSLVYTIGRASYGGTRKSNDQKRGLWSICSTAGQLENRRVLLVNWIKIWGCQMLRGDISQPAQNTVSQKRVNIIDWRAETDPWSVDSLKILIGAGIFSEIALNNNSLITGY